MKKRYFLLNFLFPLMLIFISSCGTGGNSDEGISSVIEIERITPQFLKIDLVKKIDNDDDGTCDYYETPIGDSIQITFRSKVPDKIRIQPSDISITEYTLTYYPKTDIRIPVYTESFKTSCTIPAGQTATCTFPVFNTNDKRRFYRNMWFDDFDVEIQIKGKEVIYDRSITLYGNFTARISDIQEEGEDLCIRR